MWQKILIGVSLVLTAVSASAELSSQVSIIPLPKSLKIEKGYFTFHQDTAIYASDAASLSNAKLLQQALMQTQGRQLQVVSGHPQVNQKNVILFSSIERATSTGAEQKEAYQLIIQRGRISIQGSTAGQFYAIQSLLQMLPLKASNTLRLPAMTMQDQPRFAWRGLHLDVGRHMFSVEFIKSLLDQMAIYKMNTFHWHLTEDQGWRIEIKKYPKLTEVGAFRKETMKERNFDPYIGDGKAYGGFYTQEQIKDIVAYAQTKHIEVVPEIELPGHSLAALAAYPELACTPGPFEVGTVWGVIDDILCPSEKTFEFLNNVLGEVMDLFPSQYIHIGGDEAPKTRWKASSIAQAVMQREGLASEEELQSYFIRRVGQFIHSKGKRMIGWDEILEGGLAPNATVMSWRGEAGGIAAAKEGHEVIMTPTAWCYFDAGQGPKEQELWQLGGDIPIQKVYSYNPVPSVLSVSQQRLIRGVQANVWTEYLPTEEKVEYMVFPRLLAMAEVAWSEQAQRDFAQFEARLEAHYPRLSSHKIRYRIPRPYGLDQVQWMGQHAKIQLRSPVQHSRLYVSLDGSIPDEKTALTALTLRFRVDASKPVTVKVLTVLPDGRRSAIQQARVPTSATPQNSP
ncbi:beta-N-acetylhexosaminidase [Undibacterium fentianense]|uniref:beta-N-acetylhexosaminidase n=1 Tax=Undibacterium fentianense TaxID=2828728 RepID=A0A941DZT4_9BURK|nr:beta-N-acetylhexosaminidase [Undibacterium fentianense]MBR7800559.1 beta-N-acetylhexosaminidase [Undibacterium fentianense]